MFPGFGLVIMLACASFYYKAAEMEHASGALWAGLSLLLWLLGAYAFGLGLIGCLVLQLGLFAGLTFRKMRDMPQQSRTHQAIDENENRD